MSEQLNTQLSEYGPIKRVSDAVRVKPLYVAATVAIALLSFMMYGWGGQLVSTLVGSLYPAFESFKALELEQEAELRFWLAYWVVYAVVTFLESLFYYVLIWIPFYYPMKMCILIWLFMESTRGAGPIYRLIISPFLRKHRVRIDSCLEHAGREFKRGASGLAAAGAGGGFKQINKLRKVGISHLVELFSYAAAAMVDSKAKKGGKCMDGDNPSLKPQQRSETAPKGTCQDIKNMETPIGRPCVEPVCTGDIQTEAQDKAVCPINENEGSSIGSQQSQEMCGAPAAADGEMDVCSIPAIPANSCQLPAAEACGAPTDLDAPAVAERHAFSSEMHEGPRNADELSTCVERQVHDEGVLESKQ